MSQKILSQITHELTNGNLQEIQGQVWEIKRKKTLYLLNLYKSPLSIRSIFFFTSFYFLLRLIAVYALTGSSIATCCGDLAAVLSCTHWRSCCMAVAPPLIVPLQRNVSQGCPQFLLIPTKNYPEKDRLTYKSRDASQKDAAFTSRPL